MASAHRSLTDIHIRPESPGVLGKSRSSRNVLLGQSNGRPAGRPLRVGDETASLAFNRLASEIRYVAPMKNCAHDLDELVDLKWLA